MLKFNGALYLHFQTDTEFNERPIKESNNIFCRRNWRLRWRNGNMHDIQEPGCVQTVHGGSRNKQEISFQE